MLWMLVAGLVLLGWTMPAKATELMIFDEDNSPGFMSPSTKNEVGCPLNRVYKLPEGHQTVFRVGVLGIRGPEAAWNEFNTTFGEYLTATAGQQFDPPIRFEMKPLNFLSLFSDTEAGLVDLIYVNPSAFSCIGAYLDRGNVYVALSCGHHSPSVSLLPSITMSRIRIYGPQSGITNLSAQN